MKLCNFTFVNLVFSLLKSKFIPPNLNFTLEKYSKAKKVWIKHYMMVKGVEDLSNETFKSAGYESIEENEDLEQHNLGCNPAPKAGH